ncbi:hypothetical protein M0R45_025476 [Rubus argutus]|uniref:Glycosyl hydrolase family 81 C-terminal domain-containing protein n=1 Tax=Rubus argutus TaxID=59490 RepID=A0AAW1WXA9_RUBAR
MIPFGDYLDQLQYFSNRSSGISFALAEWRECLLGIQLLPIVPIAEDLFSDVGYVRELLKWTEPALSRECWGRMERFVYSLQGVYDKNSALDQIQNLNGHDDGSVLISKTLVIILLMTLAIESIFLPDFEGMGFLTFYSIKLL